MRDTEIYRMALETYGIERQIKKFFEETAEAQEAVCKCSDNRDTIDHMAEELADVFVIGSQIAEYYGCTQQVKDWIEKKIKRLERNIKQ